MVIHCGKGYTCKSLNGRMEPCLAILVVSVFDAHWRKDVEDLHVVQELSFAVSVRMKQHAEVKSLPWL
eukprot:scaffold1533_cov98-Cylindrotheca_fusiformis.AAC.1